MATQVEIINLALAYLGDYRITAVDEDTPTSRKILQVYSLERDALLRGNAWNFALDRITLTPAWLDTVTATNSSGKVQIERTSHGYTTGQRVSVRRSGEVDGTWTVTTVDSNNFTLDDSSWNAAITAADIQVALAPAFEWGFQMALPSDYLGLLEVNGMKAGVSRALFEIEAGKLLINSDTAQVRYIKRATEASFDAAFVRVLALKVAAAAALQISQSSSRQQELEAQANREEMKAILSDAVESAPLVIDSNYGREAYINRMGGAFE